MRNRIVFGAHTASMSEGGLPGERIGDAVAARTAVMAIYERRKTGMAI